MHKPSTFCLTLFAVFSGVLSAQSFPDGPGKDVFLAVCSSCHAPDHVIGKSWTKPQWTAKVLEMLQEEPDVVQSDRDKIVEYLSKNFPAAKVNVNRASAKELASSLDLSSKDAEAIIGYREKAGSFKTLEDLKKVPGVDPMKVETLKERLEF